MTAPTDDRNPKIVHVYDDIEEEDNHLPNWWLFILYATMVFAFGYWFVFHTAKLAPGPRAVYQADVKALIEARAKANPTSPEALLAIAADPAKLEAAKGVFLATCAACHGQKGEGIIGPNLTDGYWIHGKEPADLLKAAIEGFPTKGMPAWGAIVGPEKSVQAAAWVYTLRNTNVPGKAPQGAKID